MRLRARKLFFLWYESKLHEKIKAFDHNYSPAPFCVHACRSFWDPCVHVGNDSAAVMSEGKAREIKRLFYIKSHLNPAAC